MSWRNGEQFGHQLLRELYATMRISEEWVNFESHGFTWWPGEFTQRIWCEDGVFQQATSIYRMHAETELIRGSKRAQAFELALEREVDNISLSGLIYDSTKDTYLLHSSVFASEENMQFLKMTCFAAVMLQIREAYEISRHLQVQLNAVPAITPHPVHGVRTQPDPLLGAAEKFFAPQGQAPSKWINVAEWRETEFAIEREADSFETDHQTHATAHFPWHASPSEEGLRLDVTTQESHPLLGNGLHFTLTVPLNMPPERASHLALSLNQHEREDWKRAHMLGSWSCHNNFVAYRCFIPNTLYRPEILPEMVINMSVRANWVNEYFVELRRQASGQ